MILPTSAATCDCSLNYCCRSRRASVGEGLGQLELELCFVLAGDDVRHAEIAPQFAGECADSLLAEVSVKLSDGPRRRAIRP